ncbi:MAG: putative 2-dehydropantoate 2-reductase [Draconibacterium sp.]
MGLKYAVIGTGAIGGYYGGKLAKAGQEVHFLFRSDFEQTKKNGLQIDSVNGDFLINPVLAYNSTDDMPACDVILVGLKTTANYRLASLLKPILHKNSLVILIQNGLGVEEKLAEELPDTNIAGGLAFICSQKNSPAVISHLDLGRINLGLYRGNKELLQQVCNDFCRAGVDAHIAESLGYARWHKLVWNVPFNGMCVVLNSNTDRLLENESIRELSYDMMKEVVEAAQKCGYNLDSDLPDKMIKMTLGMEPYAPSMKLDFDNKRALEVEAIYSAPVKAAQKAGYEMKKVAMLEQQLQFINSKIS